MQTAFLVVTKETGIASYLTNRSILDVHEEHRSLSELNLDTIGIVDVNKLIYIYYSTGEEGDLSFRADMNTLRTLTTSAFFHADEMIFVLVNNDNPLMEDLIMSALRGSDLPKDKIAVHHHSGTLLFQDVGRYVSGSALGQQTTSTYRDVYIREADKEERDRFDNTKSSLEAVLPTLTDMATLYHNRASVEALSSGRIVLESSNRPVSTQNFTRMEERKNKIVDSFIISGERWTKSERAAGYLVEYCRGVGRRVLVINLNNLISIEDTIGECTVLSLLDIKNPVTPEKPIAVLNARFDQLAYILEFLRHVRGVEQYIFNVLPGNYRLTHQLITQFSETVYAVYVAHYTEGSIREYLDAGLKAQCLWVSFERFKSEDIDLKKYKDDFKGTIVAVFPTEDVDYSEFYFYSTGEESYE